jgi:hypothetical protein
MCFFNISLRSIKKSTCKPTIWHEIVHWKLNVFGLPSRILGFMSSRFFSFPLRWRGTEWGGNPTNAIPLLCLEIYILVWRCKAPSSLTRNEEIKSWVMLEPNGYKSLINMNQIRLSSSRRPNLCACMGESLGYGPSSIHP